MKINKEYINRKKLIIIIIIFSVSFLIFGFIGAGLSMFAFSLYLLYHNLNKDMQIDLEPPNNVNIISISFPLIHIRENNIIYENESFKSKIDKESLKYIDFKLNKQVFKHNNVKYLVFANKQDDYIESIFIPFEKEDGLIQQNNISVMAGLIFIDNFEEVMETVEEIRWPLILALIDRKINSLIQNIDGIVKKFEKDRYIIIFPIDKLDGLIENKFEILKQIRDIDMGNKIPFTLSIGLGRSDKGLSKSMENARVAIDLALGRSGDQVVIKDGETYKFYGGNSNGVGKNTRVRARVKAYVLTDLIQEASNILIMGHRNPDLDSLGACVGVFNIASSLGKKCNIVLNSVTGNIKGLYDKLMEVDAYKQNCFINGEEAVKTINNHSLLIIVDCHRPSFMEHPQLVNKISKIVVFDHHRKGAEFIEDLVLTYHEPYASSTCELITEMMQYVKQKIKLTPTEADAILSGISLDTKNFAIKTGAKTFEAAAYLRRNGADPIRVKMLMQNDMKSYKAKSIAINSAKIFKETVAIASCPTDVENPSLITSQTADDLLNIVGIETSFACCFDKETGKIIISARSLGEINVQRIMEKLGGGGHQTVAGAQILNKDINYVLNKLESAIEEYLEEMV